MCKEKGERAENGARSEGKFTRQGRDVVYEESELANEGQHYDSHQRINLPGGPSCVAACRKLRQRQFRKGKSDALSQL